MKILSSSPYSTFNVKEWNSLSGSCRAVDPKNPVRLQKKYFKEFIRFESEEVYKNTENLPNEIQLSFV